MNFMNELAKNETAYTENGMAGYKTTGSALVDLNFAVPKLRNEIDKDLFERAYHEDKVHTLKWLLYLRDVREGIGERKSFREYVKYLCEIDKSTAIKFIDTVDFAEYGRWDDYIDVMFSVNDGEVYEHIARKILNQFTIDANNFRLDKPISLLAKWMPSVNASSKETVMRAKRFAAMLGLTERQYRKLLSGLREYLDVVERKMSANEWDAIEYKKVPSKANLIYNKSFFEHDTERRESYLESLKKGETKINANAMFLHDIVNKYGGSWYSLNSYDETLEQLWKAQKKTEGFKDTLVVRDGSGSMECTIGNSSVTALNVCNAISIYCSENNTGYYKDKMITFSSSPKVIDLSAKKSLHDKLDYLRKHDDCSNTNIAKVFELVLDTAIKAKATQEDMPATILIISDMEFDYVSTRNDKKAFETFAERYAEAGYELPKLVFWNVNSRTSTNPLTENKNGVILISGFSKNLMSMVMSSELSPYRALLRELDKERYSVVDTLSI